MGMGELLTSLIVLGLIFLAGYLALALLGGVLAVAMRAFQVVRDSTSAFRRRGLQTPF